MKQNVDLLIDSGGIRGADLNLSDQATIDDDEKIDIRTFDDYMLLNS